MRSIRVHSPGGPEQLTVDEVELREPSPGEARVKLEAIGINFIDVYHREGVYPVQYPFTLGSEAAGVVEAVGAGVTEVKIGDRVVSAQMPNAYSEASIAPADRLVQIPAGLDTRTAAAVMLQGMTAQYLTRSSYPIQPGDVVLIHAAAGGVGLLLVQMAKLLGATVYGTVGSEDKARLAREAGCDEVLQYTKTDFTAEVKRLTNGVGVVCVYDSVGKSTFEGSLDSLRKRGYMVSFGNSSGVAPPVAPVTLMNKGSLFLTRPTLAHYTVERSELLERANDVFNMILQGKLKVRIDREFPLVEAAAAQRLLESRGSSGKLLLIP